MELLKDALPTATRIALLFTPDDLLRRTDLAQAEQVARRLGLVVRPYPVRRGDEIEAAIAVLSREDVDGLHIPPAFPFIGYPRETGGLLLKYRVPAISELRQLRERRASFLWPEPLRCDAATGLLRRFAS
jgi:putative ABC transport system substrate-binding protein